MASNATKPRRQIDPDEVDPVASDKDASDKVDPLASDKADPASSDKDKVDPFDPAKLRLDPKEELIGVKKDLATVPNSATETSGIRQDAVGAGLSTRCGCSRSGRGRRDVHGRAGASTGIGG